MAYRFFLLPKSVPAMTPDAYMARFLVIGFAEISSSRPGLRAIGRPGSGIVTIEDRNSELRPFAVARIGLVTLGWDAAEVLPRVEEWLRVAEQTDSLIFDGATMDPLVDEESIAACVDRVVVKRRACFRGSVWVPRKDAF